MSIRKQIAYRQQMTNAQAVKRSLVGAFQKRLAEESWDGLVGAAGKSLLTTRRTHVKKGGHSGRSGASPHPHLSPIGGPIG